MMVAMRPASALALGLVLAACDAAAAVDAGIDAAAPPAPATLGPADRPAPLVAPPAHDGVTPLPLLVLLHGYGASAEAQDTYLGVTRAARAEGVYVLLPDGTRAPDGQRFWDLLGLTVDDHGYLRGLVEEARAALPVSQVLLLGHSNGGFMAYRLACDSGDVVGAIASLAGSDGTGGCEPAAPTSVLQIHGTADATVAYEGGTIAGLPYPSAPETVARWAAQLGCADTPATGPELDLLGSVDGAETEVTAYAEGCAEGARAELWTMRDGAHIPAVQRDFSRRVIAWLRDHAR